jgi:hypothetical protein
VPSSRVTFSHTGFTPLEGLRLFERRVDPASFSMAKDLFKTLKPLSPARLEEREWLQRAEEAKKFKKAKDKAKPKRR